MLLDEAQRMYIDFTKGLTHAEIVEFTKNGKAEMLAQRMGKDDFFYCHWLAESEDDIRAILKDLEIDKMVVTSVNEMSRYATSQDMNLKVVGEPENE